MTSLRSGLRPSGCHDDAARLPGRESPGAEVAGGPAGVPAGPDPQPLLPQAVSVLRGRAPGRLEDAAAGSAQPQRRGGRRDAAAPSRRRAGLRGPAARPGAAGGCARAGRGRVSPSAAHPAGVGTGRVGGGGRCGPEGKLQTRGRGLRARSQVLSSTLGASRSPVSGLGYGAVGRGRSLARMRRTSFGASQKPIPKVFS